MRNFVITLILMSGFILGGCGAGDTEKTAEDERVDNLKVLVEYMTGSFSSQEQSQVDSNYFDIRLEMVPIWTDSEDGYWLYVEQAVAGYLDQPYRQRVYHVTQLNDTTFESAVFTFEEPLRFAGKAWEENPLGTLTPDSLNLRAGCSIFLFLNSNGTFSGSTREQNCESNLGNAAYATSEVVIGSMELISWDRGFDAEDIQVWGAEKGGYIFKKILQH